MRSFAIRHRGFHVMFYSLLSIEESSVFVARLKSPRFLFLVSEQWHQHVTFINLRSSLSHWILWWKIPPQAKVEHAVTKQVWGHWKLSFTNKWEWQERTQPVTAMLQCDGGCATGISCWLNGRITLGYGWLFGWVTCAVLSEQEQPYVLAVIMTACYSLLKWQYESEKKTLS